MSYPSKSQYLDSKVQTASQPQLHMMLLDGAIRFGRQAQKAWTEDNESIAIDQIMVRMVDIVEAMVNGTSAGTEDSSKPLSEQYAFIYRELTACRLGRDLEKLGTCLQLLEYQRETWKLACKRLAEEVASSSKTTVLTGMHTPEASVESFSLEA